MFGTSNTKDSEVVNVKLMVSFLPRTCWISRKRIYPFTKAYRVRTFDMYAFRDNFWKYLVKRSLFQKDEDTGRHIIDTWIKPEDFIIARLMGKI